MSPQQKHVAISAEQFRKAIESASPKAPQSVWEQQALSGYTLHDNTSNHAQRDRGLNKAKK